MKTNNYVLMQVAITCHTQDSSYLWKEVAERSSAAADKFHLDQSDADQCFTVQADQSDEDEADQHGAVQTDQFGAIQDDQSKNDLYMKRTKVIFKQLILNTLIHIQIYRLNRLVKLEQTL